ncbi:MAG TPA: hypothetical protein VKG23_05590 [Thermoanaerobaculia bacterium]|nr:hypothetical protein [Thermoanaerobaculia bacterium]
MDLDGDGREETVSATSERGAVRLAVRDSGGALLASGKAPAPSGDVVHVELTAGSLGSAGALLEVSASTDASACVSIWRFRDGRLARLPIRDAKGKDLPDCERAGEWTYRFDSEGEGRPAELVRERTEKSAQGALRVREAFAFAGFSLDADPRRSAREIEGVPIPEWPDAVYYSTAALENLYGRYDLSRMKTEPTLRIHTDRNRGVFALEFSQSGSSVTAPVDAYAARGREVDLGAKVGDKTARLTVGLGGELIEPVEVRVEGLGEPYDRMYGPAGTLHGRGPRIFESAADELAVQELESTWLDSQGGHWPLALEGSPPYRLRVAGDLYDIDLGRAEKPADLVLRPVAAGRPWGIVLRGRNVIERIPVTCAAAPSGSPAPPCQAEGPPERMRRLGARANVE